MMSRFRPIAPHLLCVFLLVVPCLAIAGPNAGATLILHASSVTYTTDIQDWCGSSGLSACSSAVVTLPWDPGTTRAFYVIAAFPDEAAPRLKATSWGIDWDESKLVIFAHGSCADFNVPDGDWPAAGTGIGQSFDSTRTGLLTELYFIGGPAATPIEIYDVSGRRLRVLVGAEQAQPGYRELRWDRRDDRGRVLSSGIYFVKVWPYGYGRPPIDQHARVLVVR